MLSLSSLLLLVVFAAVPVVVVRGRCEGTLQTCGNVPPASCHGFSLRFCEGMKNTCDNKCGAVGCTCEWTQVGFACETGSSSCRWKGKCVPDGPVVTCESLSTEVTCVKNEGCQWVNTTTTTNTNTTTTGTTSNSTNTTNLIADPTPAPPPLKLNNNCMDEIEKIGACLSGSPTSQCLDCSLGKKGIVVPDGGFRTCQQVQQEYCKAGSQTLASGGYLTDCCGSCQDEVVEYLQCLYGCSELTCDKDNGDGDAADSASTTSSSNVDPQEPPSTTAATTTEATSPTEAVVRNDPNLRRHRDRRLLA